MKNLLTPFLLLGLLVPSLSLANEPPPEIQQTDQIIPIFFFLTQENSPTLIAITPGNGDSHLV